MSLLLESNLGGLPYSVRGLAGLLVLLALAGMLSSLGLEAPLGGQARLFCCLACLLGGQVSLLGGQARLFGSLGLGGPQELACPIVGDT